MTRIKTILLLIALLLLATSAQASIQTYTWTAPTDGSPVHHYVVRITVNGGEWILLSVEPTTTTVQLEFEDNVIYTVSVAGVDADGHQGKWAEASNPYAYTVPGTPGKVWREQ